MKNRVQFFAIHFPYLRKVCEYVKLILLRSYSTIPLDFSILLFPLLYSMFCCLVGACTRSILPIPECRVSRVEITSYVTFTHTSPMGNEYRNKASSHREHDCFQLLLRLTTRIFSNEFQTSKEVKGK